MVPLFCNSHDPTLRTPTGVFSPASHGVGGDDRFFVAWIFDRDMESQKYRFSQRAQLLLAGDRAEPIAHAQSFAAVRREENRRKARKGYGLACVGKLVEIQHGRATVSGESPEVTDGQPLGRPPAHDDDPRSQDTVTSSTSHSYLAKKVGVLHGFPHGARRNRRCAFDSFLDFRTRE